MTLLTKQQLKDYDIQFLGGDWRQAHKLVKDYPDLRTRWTYEQVCQMYNLLAEIELEGLNNKRSLVLLYQYMELRGDVGDLSHCQEYRTGEYCVMLWLMRQEEYKVNATQRRKENAKERA